LARSKGVGPASGRGVAATVLADPGGHVTSPDVEIPRAAYGIAFPLAFMLVGRAVLDGHGASGGSWDYHLLAVLAVLAMGWQNAALCSVAGFLVHTTFESAIIRRTPGGEPINAPRGIR
jgi:hypothetical protein